MTRGGRAALLAVLLASCGDSPAPTPRVKPAPPVADPSRSIEFTQILLIYLPVHDHVQKIGRLALADQFHVGWEPLQERTAQQRFEVLGLRCRQDRQFSHFHLFVAPHGQLSPKMNVSIGQSDS